MSNYKLLNQRIGILTVLSGLTRILNSGRVVTAYRCKCDCGKEVEVLGSSLYAALRLNKCVERSCGCLLKNRGKFINYRTVDLTGKKFGIVKVLSRARDKSGRGTTYYDCQCDCGTYFRTTHSNLLSSQKGNKTVKRSCGCLQKKWIAERSRKEPFVAEITQVISYYRCNASKAGISWEISREQFSSFLDKPCHYCSITSSCTSNTPCSTNYLIYNGIDRVDSTRGYCLDNLVTCCKLCNWAKGDLSAKEFLSHIVKIKEHVAKKIN